MNKKYDIFHMGSRPLEHEVEEHGRVVIPKGALGVGIAFRQSPYTFRNPRTHRRQNLNVYFWRNPATGKNIIVHAK